MRTGAGRRIGAIGAKRVALLLAAGALASLAGGCTVGDGTGSATGEIFYLGCGTDGSNYGIPGMERAFDLSPQFFAGEPIEDIAVAMPANRLVIRLQRTGNRIEVNDILYIDVQNAYEVARCLRGQIKDGVPQWDYTRVTTDALTRLPTTTPWCDWSGAGIGSDGGVDGGADGGDGGIGPAVVPHARIHIGVEEVVRSQLQLLFTCHKANLVGVARDGWIDFQDFGNAIQDDRPPELRDPIKSDFKVAFGDRLRATFSVVLEDQRRVAAVRLLLPIPPPLIGGEIHGSFDFDLERGRAAQPFP